MQITETKTEDLKDNEHYWIKQVGMNEWEPARFQSYDCQEIGWWLLMRDWEATMSEIATIGPHIPKPE